MSEQITIEKDTLKKLIKTHSDATGLLDEVVEMIDAGEEGKACQHIGAELEARIQQMQRLEEEQPIIRDLINEIYDEQIRDEDDKMQEFEEEIFGETI